MSRPGSRASAARTRFRHASAIGKRTLFRLLAIDGQESHMETRMETRRCIGSVSEALMIGGVTVATAAGVAMALQLFVGAIRFALSFAL